MSGPGALARTAALFAPLWFGASVAHSYPLDAAEETGIARLEAYDLAQTGRVRGPVLPPGARQSSDSVRLRLQDQPDFEIPPGDPALLESIVALMGENASGYSIAVLDLTDPDNPRFAAHNGEAIQNPGSVGKLMVALGWFQALADIYPDDPAARHALMRDTQLSADPFIRSDSHKVPFWQPGDAGIEYRPIGAGDTANLWTWLDWMMSSSSNAAASTMMAQLVLLADAGADYPLSAEASARFFRDTPKAALSRIFRAAIQQPITRNGLDLEKLRQGSFFTREGKNRVPGTNSVSTPLELLHLLVKMEQGKLVDAYSSLEIKKLIYLTERRIRYASSPSLRRAAVYFKSGSLYSCRPESGFECGKYRGNVRNFLNSATIVETDEPGRRLHYIVVLLSNVLRVDSADIHREMATEIHRIIERDHPVGGPTSAAPTDAPGEAPAPDQMAPGAGAGPVDEIDTDEETEAGTAQD